MCPTCFTLFYFSKNPQTPDIWSYSQRIIWAAEIATAQSYGGLDVINTLLRIFSDLQYLFPSEIPTKVFDVVCYFSRKHISSLRIRSVNPFCMRRKFSRHWNKYNWCRATWLILQKTSSCVLQRINASLSSLLRGLMLISLIPPLLTAFLLMKPAHGGERKISLRNMLPTEAQVAISDHILKFSLAVCGQPLWF